MKYFVLNLKKNVENFVRFASENECAGMIERIEAVDGTDENMELLEKKGYIQPGLQSYSKASLGVALSHRKLWEKSIELSEAITIVQDDAVLDRKFIEKSKRLIKTLPERWELVSWGWNFDAVMQFSMPDSYSPCVASYDQDQLRHHVSLFKRQDASHQLYRLHSQFGAVAYTISPRGAKAYLKCCFPLTEKPVHISDMEQNVMNCGIDVIWNERHRHGHSFVCFPPLAITRNEGTNTT